MPNRAVLIDSFRDLPGESEIVGLGDLRQPYGGAQEAELAVLLAVNVGAPGFNAAETRILWLGCGQLDLLVPGSRWRSGQRIGQAPAEAVTSTFEWVRDERVGEGADPQPAGERPFPSRLIAASPGFLLRQITAEARKGPELILLPQMELLRCLFGVSSGFLLELFDGIRNPAVSGERGLVSRSRSQIIGDGTVMLVAGRNLSRDEALIAASVVADPDMRRLHDSAFQQLSVRPEWRGGRPIGLNLTWPWTAPVQITLEGRWVERVGGRRRFIASRILAIGIPLSFRRVEVHYPGGESGRHDDLPQPEGRMRSANARLVVLTTGRAASPSRRSVEIATAMVNLSAASGIEVVSVPCGGITRRDRGGIAEEPRDQAPFGTGGRQPGADTDVGPAGTTRKRAGSLEAPTRSLAEALDVTWSALQAACRGKGWALDALPRFNRASRDARHGGLDLPREPLVVRVSVGRRRVLVVDRGSPTGDECSLGILSPRDSGKSDGALAVSARKASEAVCGRWRSPRLHAPDFEVVSINRATEVWADADAYAKLLQRRLASALGV